MAAAELWPQKFKVYHRALIIFIVLLSCNGCQFWDRDCYCFCLFWESIFPLSQNHCLLLNAFWFMFAPNLSCACVYKMPECSVLSDLTPFVLVDIIEFNPLVSIDIIYLTPSFPPAAQADRRACDHASHAALRCVVWRQHAGQHCEYTTATVCVCVRAFVCTLALCKVYCTCVFMSLHFSDTHTQMYTHPPPSTPLIPSPPHSPSSMRCATPRRITMNTVPASVATTQCLGQCHSNGCYATPSYRKCSSYPNLLWFIN